VRKAQSLKSCPYTTPVRHRQSRVGGAPRFRCIGGLTTKCAPCAQEGAVSLPRWEAQLVCQSSGWQFLPPSPRGGGAHLVCQTDARCGFLGLSCHFAGHNPTGTQYGQAQASHCLGTARNEHGIRQVTPSRALPEKSANIIPRSRERSWAPYRQRQGRLWALTNRCASRLCATSGNSATTSRLCQTLFDLSSLQHVCPAFRRSSA